MWHVKYMDNYHVIPAGMGRFQIVENLSDGRHSFVDGFPTQAEAIEWLDSFLVLIGLI
jgi:hypothetical protein